MKPEVAVTELQATNGMPKMVSNLQKLGERRETGPPQGPPGETNPANTLILDFCSPELWENTFMLA